MILPRAIRLGDFLAAEVKYLRDADWIPFVVRPASHTEPSIVRWRQTEDSPLLSTKDAVSIQRAADMQEMKLEE